MVKHGIVLYDIELDGCLNGVYTNENAAPTGTIYNEIVRRKADQETQMDIAGDYTCCWIDLHNTVIIGELTIRESPNRQFAFTWTSSSIQFAGIGFLMNPRQIAVHYWTVLPVQADE